MCDVEVAVIYPKAVRASVLDEAVRVESLGVLSRFRTDFYGCLPARADALFELSDALLCTDGPVRTLIGLSLAPEHRHGLHTVLEVLGDEQRQIGQCVRGRACRPSTVTSVRSIDTDRVRTGFFRGWCEDANP